MDILVDFDGTCVMHEYPRVGKDNPNCVKVLKDLVKAGVFLNNEQGVTAFAKLLIQLNTKYPGWRQPK